MCDCRYRLALIPCVAMLLLTSPTGCQEGWREKWGRKEELPPEQPPERAEAANAVLADTISAQVLLSNMQGQYVRGFGVVIGLHEDGSSDCPTGIRDYLIDYLAKHRAAKDRFHQESGVSPARLIDLLDTAVVEVIGIVPAGAPRGTRFDVRVEAIPGTDTRSLERGLLLPCEMRALDPAASGKGMVSGTTVATAFGPVFTNPFAASAGAAIPADPRRGLVLGGGYTTEERTFRLILGEPSYSRARRLEQRINERFGHNPQTAEATGRASLTLHTPPDFADRPDRFIQLVTHLYLLDHPSFFERKLQELRRMVAEPNASYEHIALVWEGIGRVAVPYLQPLYAHEDPSVSFYSARAGLRVRDVTAAPVMAQIALSPDQPHQLQAIRELADAGYPQATLRLAPLLDSDDAQVRVAAYEALRRHRHAAVRTREFLFELDGRHANFYLDVVASSGRPLIYVRRTGTPRIAVFGERTPVQVPLFYSERDDSVTLNAVDESGDITLLGRTRYGTRFDETITVPPRLVNLVASLADMPQRDDSGRLRGLGLGYAQVIRILAALCLDGDGTIPAHVVWETTGLSDLYEPAPIRQRPESDAPAPDSVPRRERPDGEPAEQRTNGADHPKP